MGTIKYLWSIISENDRRWGFSLTYNYGLFQLGYQIISPVRVYEAHKCIIYATKMGQL